MTDTTSAKSIKILYISNVEWKSIEQRHQKIFRELSKYFDCTLVDIYKVLRKHRNMPQATLPAKYKRAYQLPNQWEIPLCHGITKLSYKHCIGDANEYDVIWITAPQLIAYIPSDYQGKIIYDCLDNHVAFTRKESRRKKFRQLEEEAVRRAACVFVTSSVLEQMIKEMGKTPVLARNACDLGYRYPLKQQEQKERYEIGFFGFIGKWINVELLEKSTKVCENISYRMVGPTDGSPKEMEGMTYVGRVEHDKLYEAIKDVDCLILPFYLNELTLAVDPVKMYEYIAFGKCIIASYYPELEYFKDFIYFYRDEEEYVKLLEQLAKEGFPVKYTKQQRDSFLENNTWQVRGQVMKEMIEDLCR